MEKTISHKSIFLASLDRCTESEEFVPAFYQRFMDSSEDVRWRFRNTDFEKQNQMLVNSLKLVAAATSGDRDGLRELRERAETHDRHHLDIKPELYEFWLESLVATASEFDELLRDDIEESWRHILSHAADYMIRRY